MESIPPIIASLRNPLEDLSLESSLHETFRFIQCLQGRESEHLLFAILHRAHATALRFRLAIWRALWMSLEKTPIEQKIWTVQSFLEHISPIQNPKTKRFV